MWNKGLEIVPYHGRNQQVKTKSRRLHDMERLQVPYSSRICVTDRALLGTRRKKNLLGLRFAFRFSSGPVHLQHRCSNQHGS